MFRGLKKMAEVRINAGESKGVGNMPAPPGGMERSFEIGFGC